MSRIFLDTSAYSIPTNDIWIAASAMQCGSALLTTDPHFRAVPQIMAEIWHPQ